MCFKVKLHHRWWGLRVDYQKYTQLTKVTCVSAQPVDTIIICGSISELYHAYQSFFTRGKLKTNNFAIQCKKMYRGHS